MYFTDLKEFEDIHSCNRTKDLQFLRTSPSFIPFSNFTPGFKQPYIHEDYGKDCQNLSELDHNYLEIDLHIKGTLNEERLIIYLTELLNQIGCEYMLESCFQNIYYNYVSKGNTLSLQEIQELTIDFLISLETILNNVKYHAVSIHRLDYSHGFLLSNILELCKQIQKIFINEFSKKINKKDLTDQYFPFIYIIEKTPSDSQQNIEKSQENSSPYNYFKLFHKFEEMADYFTGIYLSNPEAFILENPKINIFLSSFCIMKNFSNPKDREEWTESEINKIRNFDSIEFSGINLSNNPQKYKTTRNFFFEVKMTLGKVSVFSYNMNWDMLNNINNALQEIEEWSLQRSAVFKHVMLQKLGFFGYKMPMKRKNLNKIENDYINSLNKMYVFKEIHVVHMMTKDRLNPKFADKEKISFDDEKNRNKNKFNVTKAILNRIQNLFPIKENDLGLKFQDLFKKVFITKIFFELNYPIFYLVY